MLSQGGRLNSSCRSGLTGISMFAIIFPIPWFRSRNGLSDRIGVWAHHATVQCDGRCLKLEDRYALDRNLAVGHRDGVAVSILDYESTHASGRWSRVNETDPVAVY